MISSSLQVCHCLVNNMKAGFSDKEVAFLVIIEYCICCFLVPLVKSDFLENNDAEYQE